LNLSSADAVDEVLTAVVAASMRQPRLARLVGWKPVESPVSCSHIVQSPHPYSVGSEHVHVVSYPGAPFLKLTFDKESSTASGVDFVSVFTDESCSELKGRWSGHGGAWPGAWGNESLTVPGDRVVIHFRSPDVSKVVCDAAEAVGGSHWGFRVVIEAPVREDVVQTIMESVCGAVSAGAGASAGAEVAEDASSAFKRPSLDFVRRVVAMFNNDADKAGAYVHEALQFMEEGSQDAYQVHWPTGHHVVSLPLPPRCFGSSSHTHTRTLARTLCAGPQSIWMSSAKSGLFSCGDYEVNLQTAEVYNKVLLHA
jgi:hypothetical protein